jgi:hypothetical protein
VILLGQLQGLCGEDADGQQAAGDADELGFRLVVTDVHHGQRPPLAAFLMTVLLLTRVGFAGQLVRFGIHLQALATAPLQPFNHRLQDSGFANPDSAGQDDMPSLADFLHNFFD